MGIFLGLLTGFFTAFQNNQFKRLAAVPTLFVIWAQELLGVLSFAGLVSYFHGWMLPPPIFFVFLAALFVIEGANEYCYAKAFQLSPQSLIGPMHSLTLIFLVPLSIVFLHEVPSVLGLFGIALGISGLILLGGSGLSLSFLTSERGALFMLGSALLSAASITLNKLSYVYVSPEFYGFCLITGLIIVFAYPALRKGVPVMNGTERRSLFTSMVTGVLGQATHIIGIAFIPSVYFILIKRSSTLFDVLFGNRIHGERETTRRFLGALLMLGAVALIVFA